MKMHVLSCGRMEIDRASLVSGESETERVPIPVPVYLFDHPDGYVLYDTACDPEGMRKNWPEHNKQVSPHECAPGESLPERLAALGVSPLDIRHVVVSHLHTDHAGCLHMFKNAKIHVSDTELKETLKLYAMQSWLPAYIESDIRHWLDARLHWSPIPEDMLETRICEGLTAVNFGSGHTFGMLGLLAELPKSGAFLLVSDALYTAENLGPPVRVPGMLRDEGGYRRTAALIRGYASAHGAKILFGHDMEQFEGLAAVFE